MNSSKFGRLMALLLCLVMIASQLGMTTFEAAETHDHDHEEVGVIDAAPTEPVEPEVPSMLPDLTASEPASAPAPQAPVPEATTPEATVSEVTESETTESETTESETTESETTEPEATESETTESEAAESEVNEAEAAEPQIMTMELVSAPEGGPAGELPMGDAITHAPQVTVTATGCTTVEVTITDSGNDLSEVSYVYAGGYEQNKKEGTVQVTNSGNFTFTLTEDDLKKESNSLLYPMQTLTVTAKDTAGNVATGDCGVGHTWGSMQRVSGMPATCDKPAQRITVYICGTCGEIYSTLIYNDSSSKPLGHDYDGGEPVTGCGIPENARLCGRGCGQIVTKDAEGNVEVVKAADLSHTWGEPTTVEAGCEKDGYTLKVCTACGAEERTNIVRATGHNYSAYVLDDENATCGQPVRRVSTCANCGNKRYESGGTTVPHSYGDTVALTEENLEAAGAKDKYKSEWAPTCTDAGASGRICSKCHEVLVSQTHDETRNPALGHDYSGTNDCTQKAKCTRCGNQVEGQANHDLEWVADADGHYQYCTNEGCTYTTKEGGQPLPHTWSTSAYDCTKDRKCTACGYVAHMSTSNKHNWEWVQDDSHTYHWQRCTNEGCEVIQNKRAHDCKDDGDCTTPLKCNTCGMTVKEALSHDYSGGYSSTSYNHYQVCKNCGKIGNRGEHVYTDPKDCTKTIRCTVCNQVIRDGAAMHNTYNMPILGDEQGHYQVCRNPNCGQKVYLTGAAKEHTGGEATCVKQAVCEVCHLPYGQEDANNHDGPITLQNVVDPLNHAHEGYSGDMVCQACGEITVKGHVIEAQADQHTWGTEQHYDDEGSWYECTGCGTPGPKTPHTFDGWQTDGEHHWQQCVSCAYATTPNPHEAAADAYDNDCTTAVLCATCG